MKNPIPIILFFFFSLVGVAYGWEGIVIHISDSDHMTCQECNEWHQARGWDSCGYNFVIQKDGTVDGGRGIAAVGAHTLGYNKKYLGICFVTKDKATEEQLETYRSIISMYELTDLPVYPHSNFANKTCGIEVAKQLGFWQVTAYCSCAKCNGSWGNKTASGVKPNSKTVACNFLPFGTKLKINGETYIVQDRGNTKKFGTKENPIFHVDIHKNSHKEATDCGVKYYKVDVIS